MRRSTKKTVLVVIAHLPFGAIGGPLVEALRHLRIA